MPQPISLSPKLAALLPAFKRRCAAIRNEQEALEEPVPTADLLNRLRTVYLAPLERPKRDEISEELSFLTSISVVIDLLAQGWRITATRPSVLLELPDSPDPEHEKLRIRRAHLIERDSQLQEQAVSDFIKGMEHRRLTTKGWHSIFSLMRDGEALARQLGNVLGAQSDDARADLLSRAIRPYVQIVGPGAICEHTGMRLNDIWRYFRHTWVTSYRSVPGRSMMVLVRDSAARNHPVMGIASLASSVVQQSTRDRWIGWDPGSTIERLRNAQNPKQCAKWLLTQLDEFIKAVYVRDLLRDGTLTRADIRAPSTTVVKRLLKDSERAIRRHRLYPQAARQNSVRKDEGNDWAGLAETSLFRSKRSKQLATLLEVRGLFQSERLGPEITPEKWQRLLGTPPVRRAIGKIVRNAKSARIGINMMDIAVCGAVAPYNALLGGKLVSLLLCSPEITRGYHDRYHGQKSLIASGTRGTGVTRDAQLALLCTTSLYGSPLNQYSRISIRSELLGGQPGSKIEYECLGTSEGFGSFHFSKDTLQMMGMLLARTNQSRRVNSIFGEGVNPLMRKIREALTVLGLPAEALLKHGSKRLVYGIPLASNFREFLIGTANSPRYLIPQNRVKYRTELIADYWRQRWLLRRLSKPGVLEEVANNTCVYPIRHGAQVSLPVARDDLFALIPHGR